MKYVIALFVLFHVARLAYCMNQVVPLHDTPEKTTQEFENVYLKAQDQQFTIVRTTPMVADMKEGQFFIFYSTNGQSPILHLRVGATNYIFRSEPQR